MRIVLLGLALAAAAGVLAAASPAADCPRISLLQYGTEVYTSYGIPAGVALTTGRALGTSRANVPASEDGCDRDVKDVEVLAYEGIDPRVAVAVEGLPQLAFVLGNRCFGFTGEERWSCLSAPLERDGRSYVATAYPQKPPPRGMLPLGEPVGEADLGGARVTAVRIDGVEPSVAVGIEGKPSEAYLSLDACPYEAFDNRPLYDDLRRCLTSPVWLTFQFEGGKPGDTVVAHADRPVDDPGELVVSLVPRKAPGIIVPKDRSQAIPVGPLVAGANGEASVSFEIPKGDGGRYVAAVTCESCAEAYGRTVFPAGVVGFPEEGSGGPKIVTYVLVAVFAVLVGAAIYVWRKGWARRRPSG